MFLRQPFHFFKVHCAALAILSILTQRYSRDNLPLAYFLVHIIVRGSMMALFKRTVSQKSVSKSILGDALDFKYEPLTCLKIF
jgi:hypothetical protein